MTVSECPGINPKWLKRMKTWHKKGSAMDWHDQSMPMAIANLRHYVENGFEKKSVPIHISTTYGEWFDIRETLKQYARMRVIEFDAKGTATRGACFDPDLAMSVYAAQYLGSLIDIGFGDSYRVVWGIVMGCRESSLNLARLMVKYLQDTILEDAGSERDWINMDPIVTTIYSMLSDCLGISFPEGESLKDPLLKAFLKKWRNPDPKVIEADCLAMCDFHTWFEDPSVFVYTPIEILVLFRLRQWQGLENPQIDHPIMNTPLGKLPEESPLRYDELLSQVYARMVRDGFDETIYFADDDWCKLRRQAVGIKIWRDPDMVIAAETKALALAEQADPCGLRVFNGLRSLAGLHHKKGLKTESVGFYERALAIARQNPDCDAGLMVDDLAALYRDLGRTAEAETLVQSAA